MAGKSRQALALHLVEKIADTRTPHAEETASAGGGLARHEGRAGVVLVADAALEIWNSATAA